MAVPKWKILYDEHCNLCLSSVRFVRKRDSEKRFEFVGLASEVGTKIRKDLKIKTELDSIILTDGMVYYTQSEAVWRITERLSFPWNLGKWLKLFPRKWGSVFYRFVARNRFRWFGKSACKAGCEV